MFIKKTSLFIIIVFHLLYSYSQDLSTTDLVQLTNKHSWNGVNDILTNKGWVYYESVKGDDEKQTTITWSYQKNYYDNKSTAWFYLFTHNGLPAKICYTIYNSSPYNIIKKDITLAGFKMESNSIENNSIIAKYSNSNYLLSIITTKDEKFEEGNGYKTVITYSIFVIKKSSIYDVDNGVKTRYHDDGVTKSIDYTVLNGTLNGPFTTYYENGKIKKTGFFKNGKQHGLFKEFNVNGLLFIDYQMVDTLKQGPYVLYSENGSILQTGYYINDMKSGLIKEYNDEENIISEYTLKNNLLSDSYKEYIYQNDKLFGTIIGFYNNNKKTGKWTFVKFDKEKLDTLLIQSYKNDKLEGFSKEVKNDSIIFSNYENGQLNGSYDIYASLSNRIFGIITGDTTNTKHITTGYYINGKRYFKWEEYSIYGNLLDEGNYTDDKKSGEWKYYYDLYYNSKNPNGIEPYSKELYLVENYENDMRNGKSVRYSNLWIEVDVCDTSNHVVNPLDTCYTYKYRKINTVCYFKNDMLHGPYESTEGGSLLVKGNFINDKKNGFWHERNFEILIGKDYSAFYEGYYKNGIKDGKWDLFNNNEYKYAQFEYSNGLLNGKSICYYESKKIKHESFFINGSLSSLILYDTLGVNTSSFENINNNNNLYSCDHTFYINDFAVTYGVKFWSMFRPNAFSPEFYQNFFSYDFTQSTSDTNSIVYGDISKANSGWNLDGLYLKLNKNTNKCVKTGMYKNHKKSGVFKTYFHEKDVFTKQNFTSDEIGIESYFVISTDKLFTGKLEINDGETKSIIRVKNGIRNGKSKYYDEKGKLVKIVKFKQGIVID